MATQVKIKRSSVSGRVPVTADLELGELAINTYDGKLYLKKNNGTESVVEVGLSGGTSSTGLDFQSYIATASQTTFAVAYTPPNVTVVVNGAVLNPADYTATNGTSVVLSTACNTGDVVSVYGFATLSVGYGLPSLTGNSGKYLSTDGTGVSWQTVSGGGGTVDLSAVAQNILPSTDVAYDLGSASKRWRDLYLSGSTINLGGAIITSDATTGVIALLPKPTIADPNPSGIVISPAGGLATVASTGGVISSENFTAAANQATAPSGGSGGAIGAGGDQVFYENSQTITTSYTITTGKNALTAGPVTIETGAVVTIPAGSRWVIL